MDKYEFIIRSNQVKAVKKMCSFYRYCKLKLLRKYELNKEEIECYKKFKEKFERCLDSMSDFESKCIRYTFLEEKFYWWESIYSTAQYYRYRYKAINNFLDFYLSGN